MGQSPTTAPRHGIRRDPTLGRSRYPQQSADGDDVAFVAYRPARVEPEKWFDLLVYAHRDAPIRRADGDLVEPGKEVERQASTFLAAARPLYGDPLEVGASAPVRSREVLRFVPWFDPAGSVQIDPPQRDVVWSEPIHAVDFRVRVGRELLGRTVSGGVDVFAGVLLIGEIRFRVRVLEAGNRDRHGLESVHGVAFWKIFASHLHHDRTSC